MNFLILTSVKGFVSVFKKKQLLAMCVDLVMGTKYLGFFKLSTSDENIWKVSLYTF